MRHYLRSRWFALCFVFAVLAAAQHSHAQLTVEQLIGDAIERPAAEQFPSVRDAIKHFFEGQAVDARKSLVAARSAHKELPPPDLLLARLWLAAGRLTEARAALEQCVFEEGGDPEAYLVFGELALRENRLTDAQLSFERGKTLCESKKEKSFRWGNLTSRAASGVTAVALGRGNWIAAERLAREWLQQDADSANAAAQLGRALFFQQKYRDAYSALQKSYELNPASPLPEINMALLYEELVQRGDREKHVNARNAMRAAEEKDADNFITRLAIARWAMETCEIDIAMRNTEAALKLVPNSFEARLLQGLAARHKKDFLVAEQAFAAAHQARPSEFVAISQLALSLVALDEQAKLQRAVEYARLNARANSDRSQQGGRDAAVVLAWCLFRVGQNNDAVQLAQAAVQSGPLSDENAFLAAKIFASARERETALRILKAALAGERCFPFRLDAEALLKQLENSEE